MGRQTSIQLEDIVTPLRLFYIYAHEDEYLYRELDSHLRSLIRRGLIVISSAREVVSDIVWEKSIYQQIRTADIILLLISPDLMASDYTYGVEMKTALEMHERGEARVVPILLRPVD